MLRGWWLMSHSLPGEQGLELRLSCLILLKTRRSRWSALLSNLQVLPDWGKSFKDILAMLVEWASRNLMKLNMDKWKVSRLGRTSACNSVMGPCLPGDQLYRKSPGRQSWPWVHGDMGRKNIDSTLNSRKRGRARRSREDLIALYSALARTHRNTVSSFATPIQEGHW